MSLLFCFKRLPQLSSQMDSQRGRQFVSSEIFSNIDILGKQRLHEANMSICMSGR